MRFKMPDPRYKNTYSGFTLVEMIVAIAIFMIVAVVAVGSLVRIVALNRQAQTLQASVNNVGFALDSMSREIRQGSGIACNTNYDGHSVDPSTIAGDCENMQPSNQLVVFQSSKSDPTNSCRLYYAYWFAPSVVSGQYYLEKAQQTACNQQITNSGGIGTAQFYPIIDSNNVVLTGYNFALFSGASFAYKWAYVRLTGYSGVRSQDANSIDVQTSISQRIND